MLRMPCSLSQPPALRTPQLLSQALVFFSHGTPRVFFAWPAASSHALHLLCRGWTLVWGALSLLMTLIPTFRDFRLLNVIAMAGTGFTAVYIWVAAAVHGFKPGAVNLAPYNMQSFFTGANVFLWAYGGHGVSL
jgi:hypothetical protein